MPKVCYPVLRVYELKTNEGLQIPHPSPHNVAFNLDRVLDFDGVTIPGFFGQILKTRINTTIEGTWSIDIEFPFAPLTEETSPFTRELSALKTKEVSEEASIPVFLAADFRPSYIYKVDILTTNPEQEFLTYYADGSSGALATLDSFIDTNTEESYWAYLVDYTINRDSKRGSIKLSFVDFTYKMKHFWDLDYPGEDFYDFINHSKHDSIRNSLIGDSRVLAGDNLPVYDGWTLPGIAISLLYYSGLFPYWHDGANEHLDALKLDYSVDGNNIATFTVKSLNGNKSVDILKIPESMLHYMMPISPYYPEADSLLTNGFYYPSTPFQFIHDILTNLSDLIGFFWRFDTNGVLEITSDYYNIPAGIYTFTGNNTRDIDYTFDDSNLRNSITVLGQPYGLNIRYSALSESSKSIELFGRRNFVFESNLVMSDTHAKEIADNIRDTYAYAAGTVDVSVFYDAAFPLGKECKLDIEDFYDSDNKTLVVVSKDLKFEWRKRGEMSLHLMPKIERTDVFLRQGMVNFSNIEGIDPDDFIFEFDTGDLLDPAKAVNNIGSSQSVGYLKDGITSYVGIISPFSWKTYREFPPGTHQFTLSTDLSSPKTYIIHNNLSTFQTVRISLNGSFWSVGGLRFINCGMQVTWNQEGQEFSDNIFSAQLVQPYGASIKVSVKFSEKVIGGDVSAYYVPFELDISKKFFNSFKVSYVGGQAGFVESGFMIIPASPVYRRDGVPFNDLYLDESNDLNCDYSFIEQRQVERLLIRLDEDISSKHPYTIQHGGNLITTGIISDVHGLDMQATQGSIINSITTQYYIVSPDEEHESYVHFDPFIFSDLGLLAFSNVFLVVPFVKLLHEGRHAVFPKGPIFVIHAQVPIIENKDNRPMFAYRDGESGIRYVRSSTVGDFIYQVSQLTKQTNENRLVLSPRDSMVEGLMKYKSKFPFVLRLALNKGNSGLNKHINETDLSEDQHFFYKQHYNASTNYRNTTIYPFLDMEGIVTWLDDYTTVVQNKCTVAIVPYIEPFYMYSLSEFLDDKGFVAGDKDHNEKIGAFSMASRSDSTAHDRAVGSFVEAVTQRYATGEPGDNKNTPEILLIEYSPNNFRAP